MTPDLAAIEEHVAHEVATRTVCEGGSHVALGCAGRYRLAGLCVELERHPSGARRIAPPVVCAFDAEHWLRICLLLSEMRRLDPTRWQG